MRVRFSGDTHIGMKRKHNEDSFILPDFERAAIVADGMGGHASGEVASNMAVEAVAAYLKATQDQAPTTWPFKMDQHVRYETNRLVVGVKHANQRIWETSQRNEEQHGMGTTIVGALFLDDRVIIAHVGDSRCYRLRRQQLLQLTEDHSLLNDYRRMREMNGEELENFGYKNVVVRALGLTPNVFVDIVVEEYARGDVYVLCSDGLSGMISDAVIMQTVTRFESIDTASNQLVSLANEAGGVDNISAVIVRIEAG